MNKNTNTWKKAPLIFRGIFYCSAFSAAKPGITLLALYK